MRFQRVITIINLIFAISPLDASIPHDRVLLLNVAKNPSSSDDRCAITFFLSIRIEQLCNNKNYIHMAHTAAVVETLGGLKGTVQPARIYILPPRSCKYWRDVEFRVYFKRFIWRESKRSEKQFRSLRCLFSSAGAPTPEKQDRIRVQSSVSLS